MLQDKFSNVEVHGHVGRSQSFEITDETGHVIYSKFKEGSFPDNDKVVADLVATGKYSSR
jgi:hypothetical protein